MVEVKSEKNPLLKERRSYQRLRVRERLFFGVDGFEYVGHSVDISMAGIHIASTTAIPKGTKVLVGFGKDKQNIDSRVKGEIVWMVRSKKTQQKISNSHMGVRIAWRDERFLKYIATLIEKKKNADQPGAEDRGEIRYEHRIEVIFEEMGEALQQISENVSRGGIFVCTDRPLPPKTEVSLKIVIPQIMEEIKATGRVAHIVDLRHAVKMGRPPGMGIKLLGFAPGHAKKFTNFIKKLAIAYQKANSSV
jgi:type IV pilus assembly protein PilZ